MQEYLQASIQCTDSDYLAENNENYRLSIQLRLNGFSFAIVDPVEKKLIQIKEFIVGDKLGQTIEEKWHLVMDNLTQLIEAKVIVPKLFQKVIISFQNMDYTFIPTSLFLEEKKETLLGFSQKIEYPFQIIDGKIAGTDRMIVSAIYKPLYLYLYNYFSEFELIHSIHVLQNQINKIHKNKKLGNRIYVSVTNRDMHIIAMQDETLLMSNSFSFTAKEDFVYFILLAYDQLNMNAEQDSLFFLGDIGRSSAIYNICWQYIRNIYFIPDHKEINMGSDFDQISVHQYYTLIHTALCE